MATNKHAQIRYNILDRCFSNFNRVYTYEDLLNEINEVLIEIGTEGIQLRQLQYDIAHMKSDAGYRIELDEDLKHYNKRVFRYKSKNFSLANHPLNQYDSEQLESTLAILSRYKHREEFSWIEELIPRMEQAFDLVSSDDNCIVSYQENFDLKGREHISVLFNLILKQKQAKLEYEPYGKPIIEVIICPYHLKQYNNRWFLFGFNELYQSLPNYPLDRILSIDELSTSFKSSETNWLDYFDDIIGVSKPEGALPIKITLKFSEKRINYALTKPLHRTQKKVKSDVSGKTITIKVIPNPELYQLLLSFGEDLEVISPADVRVEMMRKITQMKEKYEHA